MKFNWKKIDRLIKEAFEEDLGEKGDITSNTIIPETSVSTGRIITKDEGILAGVPIVERCYKIFDDNIGIEVLIKDGEAVSAGETVIAVSGNTRNLFAVERTALNFLGHLSGIATLTQEVVRAVSIYGTVVLDTRKTTPGYRELEKYAVKVGGGANHRMGLFDGFLVKENHIRVAGGIEEAVKIFKEKFPDVTVEVEVENIEELRKAISSGADIIMLDNINSELIKKAVKMTRNEVKLEASGGITIQNVQEIASTGVHRISMGQLTDGAARLDVSFLLD